LFALPWAQLFDLAQRQGEAATLPLWSGLRVQVTAQAAADHPARGAPATTRTGTPRSLKAVETDLIHQAVRQAGGRVADAARALGVSRATVYRRLGRSVGSARDHSSD